jgi:transcriptional regulator with XRE-family HTH domain
MAKHSRAALPLDEETEEVIRQLADRLAAARKQRGLTQAELGDLADLSQQRIFDLEQGTANVTVRTLVRMAKVLELDVGTLFSGIATTSEAQLAEAFAAWSAVIKERQAQDQERQIQDEQFQNKVQSILDRTTSLLSRGGTGTSCSDQPGTGAGKARREKR